MDSFEGRVERVITRVAWKKTAALVLAEPASMSPRRLVLEDPHLIRYIEYHHHLLFDDQVEGTLKAKNIVVGLRGFESGERTFGSQRMVTALRIREVNPDARGGGEYEAVDSIVPPVPAPDSRHRFVEVPVCYTRPDWVAGGTRSRGMRRRGGSVDPADQSDQSLRPSKSVSRILIPR